MLKALFSKHLMITGLVVIGSGCASKSINPWYSYQEEFSVLVRFSEESRAENISVSKSLLHADVDLAARKTTSNCLYARSGINDPFDALLFFVFVQVPACAVAEVVSSDTERQNPERESVAEGEVSTEVVSFLTMNKEYERAIEQAMLVLLRIVNQPGGVRTNVQRGDSITLHMQVEELKLQPVDEGRYRLYLAAGFCIDDAQERFVAYSDKTSVAGKSFAKETWLAWESDKIEREFMSVAGALALSVSKMLRVPRSMDGAVVGAVANCAPELAGDSRPHTSSLNTGGFDV